MEPWEIIIEKRKSRLRQKCISKPIWFYARNINNLELILVVRMLRKKYIEKRRDQYMTFIDLKKLIIGYLDNLDGTF